MHKDMIGEINLKISEDVAARKARDVGDCDNLDTMCWFAANTPKTFTNSYKMVLVIREKDIKNK